jgi:hypothetical protein
MAAGERIVAFARPGKPPEILILRANGRLSAHAASPFSGALNGSLGLLGYARRVKE